MMNLFNTLANVSFQGFLLAVIVLVIVIIVAIDTSKSAKEGKINIKLAKKSKGSSIIYSHNGDELYFENDEQARVFRRNRIIKNVVIYTLLSLCALFTLIPFYWMIVTSFKTQRELQQIPTTFIAMKPTFDNYLIAFKTGGSFQEGNLLRYVCNTLLVASISTVISTATTILAAFAFSRLEFKGREALFSLLLTTMMVPGEMMIMTNFTTIANWHLLDTYIALILPFATSVFYIFFLRQNFKQIPNELYYAAKVDGNSDFKYLFKVMIPIARPAIITVLILSMIGSWNAYIWPRTVSQGQEFKLITDGLMTLFSSESGGDTSNIRMAATTVVSIPLLLAFACFKKYIMRGVARSGIKG